ncbi:MAG: hypothetical protein KDA45_13100, partial [Planctomycetales bacterium]|nr:hypothetical protein [Planctomycetales bacterium]
DYSLATAASRNKINTLMTNRSDRNSDNLLRDLGPQPLAEILRQLGLDAHDLVQASPDQMTHKMVARAAKGRRLTRHSQALVLRALQHASGHNYQRGQLFNY